MVGDNVDLQRDYVLGHNDLIDLKVFGQDNLSGEYRVDAGGAISIPLLGDVPASGRTAAELTQEVTDRLRDGYLRDRSEEHTSELQSLMRISYAVLCLKKK